MFLGIEIGGTKLQLAVGRGDGQFLALERRDVDLERGAAGILEAIETVGRGLAQRFDFERIGIGFGGPVDALRGRVLKSHQIDGWEGWPLADWCQRVLGRPAVLGNDCDVAALAEARWGAGQGHCIVFFVTVGTGVGGGLVVDGRLFGAGRPAVAEIGHLRPGLHAEDPQQTVESLASGWGLVAAIRAHGTGRGIRPIHAVRSDSPRRSLRQLREQLDLADKTDSECLADLHARCDGDLGQLTAKILGQAAADGNLLAGRTIEHGCQVLGWAIAQAITLVAPEVVVVGGGVSLMGEQLFFAPLRTFTARYVFPPLAGSYEILPARLGEEVVVHGALALADSM